MCSHCSMGGGVLNGKWCLITGASHGVVRAVLISGSQHMCRLGSQYTTILARLLTCGMVQSSCSQLSHAASRRHAVLAISGLTAWLSSGKVMLAM